MKMSSCILLLLVGGLAGVAGCAPREESRAGGEVPMNRVVRGEVVATDSSAMVRDGDGILRLALDGEGRLTVLIPSGESQPRAAGLGTFSELEEGDFVEVAGETTRKDELRVYRSSHYLKKISP